MVTFFKQILLFAITSFLLVIKGVPQIIYPRGIDNLDKVEKQIASSERKATIQYFIDEANKHPRITASDLIGAPKNFKSYISFVHNISRTKDSIDFFSLKPSIDDIANKYKRDTLEDIEPSKRELVRPILNKIQTVDKIKYVDLWPIDIKKVKEEKLKEIQSLIAELPNSKEKIWITLQYFSIHFSEYLETAKFNALKIRESAESLSDPFEKGIAYMFIGDFAIDHNLPDVAISMYYLAKEWVYNSTRDSRKKNYEQGRIYERIAYVFPKRGPVQASIKSCNYDSSAAEYYRRSGDIGLFNKSISLYYAKWANLTFQIEYYNNDTLKYYQKEENIMHHLTSWYNDFFSKKNGADKTCFLNFTSIGSILLHYQKIEESKYYLSQALHVAVKSQNMSDIFYSVHNMAYVFSLLGEERHAILYADLAISIGQKTKNEFAYYEGLLAKINALAALGKYRSALIYINEIQSVKPRYSNYISEPSSYPYSYSHTLAYESEPISEILEQAYAIKYSIFKALKSDSAQYYKNLFNNYKERHLKEFAQLLQVESDAVTGWLDQIKDKEVVIEKNLREVAEKNEYLATALKTQALQKANLDSVRRVQSDSISSLNIKIATQALQKAKEDSIRGGQSDSISALNIKIATQALQKAKLDSVGRAQSDSLIVLKESLRIKDSINNKIARESFIEKKTTQTRNLIGLFVVALLLLSSLYFINRERSRERFRKVEESRRKKEIELKQLDELARNKIHNFQNDYHVLSNMLNAGDLEGAKVYTTEWGAYQANFLENWKKGKDKVTLEDELILLDQYCDVKRAMGKLITFEKIGVCKNINPSEALFIQSMFDTLLDNSIRWGFKAKSGVCYFDVKVERKEGLLLCVISDNGTPPNDPNSYFRRKDSGLNILKSRVKAMYELRNMPIPEDFFTAEILPNNSGTLIKTTIPYEQVV